MVRRSLSLTALLLALFVAVPQASAGRYDLDLSRLWNNNTSGKDATLLAEGLIGDLGAALAPRFLGPAATYGSLGFQIALDYAMTNFDSTTDQWTTVLDDTDPGLFHTGSLVIRKGLPFSTEVGGRITKLFESKLWGVGMELKFAPLEGFQKLPEIAFRGTVSTFLGSDDYAILTAGGDLNISKKIGIGGVFKLAPFLGYNFLYVHGSSNVISIGYQNGELQQQVFDPVHAFKHFAVLGFQLYATAVNLGFEASITKGIQTYAFRFGTEF